MRLFGNKRLAHVLIGAMLAAPAMAQEAADPEFKQLFGSFNPSDVSEPNNVAEPTSGPGEPREWAPWWLADKPSRQFGDWHVWKVTDELDPVGGHVILTRARWRDDDRFGPFFGFLVLEGRKSIAVMGNILPLNPSSPHCDWKAASYAVDGGSPGYLVEPVRGRCDQVLLTGQAIQRFRTGSEALIRVKGTDIRVSLRGFATALRTSQQR